MGREEVIEVDFSAPVEKVIDSICRRFHLDETQKNRLTLHSPSSPGALNTRGSLAEQNVPPSCALIAKMAPPAADGGTTPSGATALAKAAVATMRGKAGGKSESDGAGAGADLTVGDVKISLGQLPSTLTIGIALYRLNCFLCKKSNCLFKRQGRHRHVRRKHKHLGGARCLPLCGSLLRIEC